MAVLMVPGKSGMATAHYTTVQRPGTRPACLDFLLRVAKFAALEDAGVYISRSPAQLGSTMVKAFEDRGMAV